MQGNESYLTDLIAQLKNFDQVRVNNKNLIDIFQTENIDVKLMSDSRQDEINQNKLDLMIKFGFSNTKEELSAISTKVCHKPFIYEGKRNF